MQKDNRPGVNKNFVAIGSKKNTPVVAETRSYASKGRLYSSRQITLDE